MSGYTLEKRNGEVVILRPDGSVIFTLAARDRQFASAIVTRLNEQKA